MKYQASIVAFNGKTWAFDWVDLNVSPGLASTADWAGAKEYGKRARLPVRELDDRGLVTREFFPAIVFEGAA